MKPLIEESRPFFALALAVLLSFQARALAQVTPLWTEHYDGSANSADYAREIKLDAVGNAYVIGTSTESGAGRDITTVKFNAQGVRQWAARYNGSDNGDDWGYSLVLDTAGNVYVTGSSYFAATGRDFATVKYNAQGEEQWSRFYDGPAHLDDEAAQVVVDQDGNVIVTGTGQGVGTLSDYATVKYSSQGDQLWAARYNGPGNSVDEGRALATDHLGNIYVSGGSQDSTTDFDYATIKYSSSGTEEWVARYDGPSHAYDVVYYAGSVAVDVAGYVLVTGYSTGTDFSYDYATIKYDTLGNPLWVARYNGSDQGMDYADAIAVDPSGNAYVTGASFDSSSGFDYLTIKYSTAGVAQWTASYNGTGNSWDEAYGMAVDPFGSVYVAGRSMGSATSTDFATIKYSPSGEERWNIRYDGTAHDFDWPFRLQLDSLLNVYVGGWSTESGTGADYTIIKYAQAADNADDQSVVPETMALQNYPNPFNTATTIHYVLPAGSHVRLTMSDLLGREIAVLVNAFQPAGPQQFLWEAHDLASGTFYCKVETANAVYCTPVILLK